MANATNIRRVGAQQGYDLWSETYDATPNPIVAMDSRHTIKFLAAARGELILDAGCGTGRNLKPLVAAGSQPIGIDFSLGMLKVARREIPDIPVAMANLEQHLPFRDSSFDAVLCALIGEHLSELAGVLHELRRTLKRRGRLVFSVYHPAMSAAGIEANFEHSGIEYRLGAIHYSVSEHIRFFEDAGFDEITVHEFQGDEQLIGSVPSALRYLDFPVLLVLTAIKP